MMNIVIIHVYCKLPLCLTADNFTVFDSGAQDGVLNIDYELSNDDEQQQQTEVCEDIDSAITE